ncbi:unnamed protein product [Calypogeia fissa]
MSHHDEELFAALARIALAGDGLVLGLGMGVLAVRTWLKYRFHSRALKQVEGTPVTKIADLRTLVEQQQQEEEDRNVDKSDSGKSEPEARQLAIFSTEDLVGVAATPSPPKSVSNKQESKLVIVRGRVQLTGNNKGERRALVALTGHERGVYLERTQTCFYNEWRGIFGWGCKWKGLLGWGSLKEQVAISRRKVPFVIAAGGASSTQLESRPSQAFVHIELEDQPRQPLPLMTVHREFHPVPASSHTFLQAMFGRRYLVGLLDEEKILPIGKEVTAVGILSASSSDGNPVIHACKDLPCFLSEGTHEQLVTELATGTKVLLWTGVAVSTITAVVLSYAIIKNWTKWKARQRERRRRDEETRQDRIWVEHDSEDVTDVPDGELCVVCLLRRRRAAFIFCGHRVCCVSCAQRIEQGSSALCPVCRQSVTGYIRVFDS